MAEASEEAAMDVSGVPQRAIVLPGDAPAIDSASQDAHLRIGNGLRVAGDGKVLAVHAGWLQSDRSNTHWVDASRKRYLPRVEDSVVGVITDRGGDYYKVNIGSPTTALLNRLAFEGATKRNKPAFKAGDVIYARVITANKHMDTELSCIDPSGGGKDWATSEVVYGELKGGMTVRVSVTFARTLLRPDCMVLNALGKHLPYEIAVGMNGLIWVCASTSVRTIAIANAIMNAQHLDDLHTEVMVDEIVSKMRSS